MDARVNGVPADFVGGGCPVPRMTKYIDSGNPAVRSSGGPCMSSDILTARKGPVLEITLNRPQIGNAASDAMAVELTKLLLGAAETSEIVVLRGAGEDFCVGRETMGKGPPG